MIRITGGEAKGRMLKVYRGGKVRPTSDKVRQAIFNILEHRYELDFTEMSALDLFAGSGSLGLELLSRGGRSATFVEVDSKAASVLRANLKIVEELRDAPRVGHVITQPVERVLRRPPTLPFDLIFADPPYRDERGPELLNQLYPDWMSPDGIMVVEHAKRDLFIPPNPWVLDDRRTYGDTLVSFMILNDEIREANQV